MFDARVIRPEDLARHAALLRERLLAYGGAPVGPALEGAAA